MVAGVGLEPVTINPWLSRIRWIDNVHEDIISSGLTRKGAADLAMTEDNGTHLFVPIAIKFLASGTDDDNVSMCNRTFI